MIKTKDWEAWIDTQPGPGKTPRLFVTGQVETTNGAIVPVLTKREPQGINETILILDLTIEDTGKPGTDDVAFRDAYKQVDIQYENEQVALIEVSVTS
mgnify:CR=1 FL=1